MAAPGDSGGSGCAGQPLDQFQGREAQLRAAIGLGFRQAIDELVVAHLLEPLQGEGWPSAIAQQPLQPGAVSAVDAHRHLIRFHGVLASNAKRRAEIIPSPPVNTNDKLADHDKAVPPSALAHIRWAQLLKRMFDIDMGHCPNCGGLLTIIAAILDLTTIAKILAHLGLPIRAPPRSPARRPDLFHDA